MARRKAGNSASGRHPLSQNSQELAFDNPAPFCQDRAMRDDESQFRLAGTASSNLMTGGAA